MIQKSEDKIVVVEKHALILRLTHWLNVPFLMLMIWSGILIYWAHQPYIKIPNDIGPFKLHHRLAEGMGWHFFLMWPFVINGIIYILYHVCSGHWREIIPTYKNFFEALAYLKYEFKISKEKPIRRGLYNPVQKIAYSGAIFMGLGSILTGLAIYRPVQLGWLTALFGGYELARLGHFALMVAFLFFILIHIIQVIRAGWNNFRAVVAGYEVK